MEVNFNNSNKEGKHEVSKLEVGNFESMVKKRKQKLPELQATIQDALKDYEGESICIIIQKEDENGLPEKTQVIMAGVSRMECQLRLSKALDEASGMALKYLVESAQGDLDAMLQIAAAIAGLANKERRGK